MQIWHHDGVKRILNRLTSNRTLAMLWLGLLAWAWSLAAHLQNLQWAWALVALFAVASVGLLMRWDWARKLSAVLLALVALNGVVRLFTNGWKLNRTFMAAGAGLVAWGLWRNPDEGWFEDDDEPKDKAEPDTLISLVLLRTTQRYLEPIILAQALSDAWGLHLKGHTDDEGVDDDADSDGFVTAAGPVSIVCVRKPSAAFFMIHNHEGCYFNDAEGLAAKVPNLRFADIIRNHHAWLSVDLLDKASSPETIDQAYRLIGKAISALADDATLALFCPQHSFFNLWSEALEAQLCGPEPLRAFREEVKAPIIGVKNDARIEDAIAEARRRWPEFVEAFHRRQKDGLPFIVKAPFTTADETEHMWLEVFALEPEYVHGHLISDPFYHRKLKKGSQVEVPVEEVSDWVFADDGRAVGNFTGAIVSQTRKGEPGGEAAQ